MSYNTPERPPIVTFADRFFMTSESIETIRKFGKIVQADCQSEEELVETIRQTGPKVIVSEYLDITEQAMDASSSLKGIVVWGAGYDHVDINAATERRIFVANTRGSNAESVAEHVFAFMLCLSRKTVWSDAFVREGKWATREESGLPSELLAHDLHGKTLGIIGFGAIGTHVAQISRGFNMRILAHDPYKSVEEIRNGGAQPSDLEALLRESDFVTLHVVLTDETRGLISTRELNLMKPTAHLINASRGPVVDEKALIEALEETRIASAGLDVFTEEPIDLSNPLLRLKNVIVSPHCAGNSAEALARTSVMVSEEVVRILQDGAPCNLVNRLQLAVKKSIDLRLEE